MAPAVPLFLGLRSGTHSSALQRRGLLRAALGATGAASTLLLKPGVSSAGANGAIRTATPATAYLPGDTYVERYQQKWALSCEYAATHTALRLLGHNVSEDVMRALLGRGEDPDETFRGEIQANQTLNNYGVHARGIARLVELLKANGHVPKEITPRLLYDLDAVRVAIAAGQPVVTWLPLGLRQSSRVPTLLPSGKTVNLVYSEHCLTLRGYDGSTFYALEPYDGSAPRYEVNALWRGMSLFDDPALALGPYPIVSVVPAAPVVPAAAYVPVSEHFPESGITLDGGFYATYRDLGGRGTLGVPLTEEVSERDMHSDEVKQVLYTEMARLEWHPTSGAFGLGFTGQDLLGDEARPDAQRPLGGAIARYVAQNGGLARFGYSISEEVPISSADRDLLPWPVYDAVGQWFQTGILIWDPYGREVVHGRAGLVLAKQRGLFG